MLKDENGIMKQWTGLSMIYDELFLEIALKSNQISGRLIDDDIGQK